MLPKITFRTTTGGTVTTHAFGNCDAGAYKPGSSGWEVRIYNDYSGDGSEEATSVNINARDSSGGIDEVWCEQHWIEVKSNGCSTGITDDAMAVFQPVGTNSPLGIGNITSTQYRTLFVRVNSPTDAEEQDIALQLVSTYQNPQSAITKWITGLRGDGIVATTGDPFAMSTGGTTGTIPYESGYALINNNEIYYGSSGSYDISSSGSGSYIIYLTESGAFGETTGSPASNQLSLYDATISSGTCTALADRRVFIAGLQAGSTDSRSSEPNKGDLFFDIINGNLYGAKTSTGWTQINSTGGGEANTASNAGTTGTGIYYQKSGVDLQFKAIRAGSSKVTVTDSTGTHTVSLDLSGVLVSSGAFTADYIPQISSTGGVLKASPFTVTTGDVFDFGAHSAVFTEQAITTTTGTASINWNNGIKALFTRSTGSNGVVTFSFTAPVGSANLMLTVRGSSTGSTGTVTWPTVKWDGGSAPSLGSAASAINVVSFYYSTGLTSYLGASSTGTYSS